MVKYLKRVKAIFKPQKIDDLRPGLEDLIGEEMTFQYSWIMEDDEQFPGVWAMLCFDERFIECDCAWAPEFDLEVLRDVT